MKYKHGNSVCISSQAGCRMGCKFCASTLGGLDRNLTPSEMLSQIYYIQRDTEERVSNVVMMGTGEPMDNYDNVLRFLELITSEDGLNISQRNITISTCGIVPKIKELAQKHLQITLAISLHSPNDEMRRGLMPIAMKYSIDELLDACHYYFKETNRRMTFEYSLVAGVNDQPVHAEELAGRLKGFPCHVNLIPVNPIKERDFKQSMPKSVMEFKKILEKNRVNVTIRREMGADINAACGQLRRKKTAVKIVKENDMRSVGASHIGKVRTENQDRIFFHDQPVGNLKNLYIVADGMGGHRAGGHASSFAVERFVQLIEESKQTDPIELMKSSIASVNQEMIAESQSNEEYRGMGTTFVAATISDGKVTVMNIGDSRLYYGNQELTQITVDHSYVEELIHAGIMEREEGRFHPKKNVITRALGTVMATPDFFEFDAKDGYLLLCSDGLSNMISDEELKELLLDHSQIANKVNQMITRANEYGGKDNISLVIVDLKR